MLVRYSLRVDKVVSERIKHHKGLGSSLNLQLVKHIVVINKTDDCSLWMDKLALLVGHLVAPYFLSVLAAV